MNSFDVGVVGDLLVITGDGVELAVDLGTVEEVVIVVVVIAVVVVIVVVVSGALAAVAVGSALALEATSVVKPFELCWCRDSSSQFMMSAFSLDACCSFASAIGKEGALGAADTAVPVPEESS